VTFVYSTSFCEEVLIVFKWKPEKGKIVGRKYSEGMGRTV